jgi:serine/threonine protein kinase
MAVVVGDRLGIYEVRDLIGAGGMGEVYRAHDTKLSRSVALKILPEAFARDPDRLARFRREAQVLAALSHSNIGSIFGFEETDTVHALVLELIEGPTLADQLAHGPLALDDALPVARQIADALEAAHAQGIVQQLPSS